MEKPQWENITSTIVESNKTLCRICGKESSEYLNFYSEDGIARNLSMKILCCLQIKMSFNDILPTIICISCCNRLDDFYKFFREAAEAQIYLREYTKSLDLQSNFSSSLIQPVTYKNEPYPEVSDVPATNLMIAESNDESSDAPDKLVIKSRTRKRKIRKIKTSANSRISEVLRDYPWYCTICESRLFNSLKALLDHFKTDHDSPPVYRCIHCARQYDRYRSFTKHFLQHENPRKFTCDVCGKSFNLKSSLASHGLVHSNDKPHTCNICYKSFKSSATLSVHKKLHLPQERRDKYLCKICEKVFLSKKSLDNHEKIHTGERNFMCDICGKAFVVKNTLEYHLATHSFEKNHLCPQCGRVFRTERLLKKHLLAHLPVKKYSCNICRKEFREKSTLNAHSRIHTGEMPFSCEHCGKKFRFAGILTIHRRLHTGERPYACLSCEKTFTNWANLNKHIRRVHKNNPDNTDEVQSKEAVNDKSKGL